MLSDEMLNRLINPDVPLDEALRFLDDQIDTSPAHHDATSLLREAADMVILSLKGKNRSDALGRLEAIHKAWNDRQNGLPPAPEHSPEADDDTTENHRGPFPESGSGQPDVPASVLVDLGGRPHQMSGMWKWAIAASLLVLGIWWGFKHQSNLGKAETRPKSSLEANNDVLDNTAGAVIRWGDAITESLRQHKKERTIAHDPRLWIWEHIGEGNYENSRHEVPENCRSFKACLAATDVRMLNTNRKFEYDEYLQSVKEVRVAWPEATMNKWPDKEVRDDSLLTAIIAAKHPFREQMMRDVLDKANESEQGVDAKFRLVNLRLGPRGRTALMVAAMENDERLVSLLLDNKADPKMRSVISRERASRLTINEALRSRLEAME